MKRGNWASYYSCSGLYGGFLAFSFLLARVALAKASPRDPRPKASMSRAVVSIISFFLLFI